MPQERLSKILLLGFLFAFLIYLAAFTFIQKRRTVSGPWLVTFSSDTSGVPALLVEQPHLHITKRLEFPGEKISPNQLSRRVFDDPNQTNAPFGEIIFQDLTFLPGTVTFNFFGHEIEFLPRTLIIDRREIAWNSNEVVTVTGAGQFRPRKRK